MKVVLFLFVWHCSLVLVLLNCVCMCVCAQVHVHVYVYMCVRCMHIRGVYVPMCVYTKTRVEYLVSSSIAFLLSVLP